MSAALRPVPFLAEFASLLAGLRALLPAIAGRGAALDHDGAFPDTDMAALSGIGLLAAPLPLDSVGSG
jgi:hypothetical protein